MTSGLWAVVDEILAKREKAAAAERDRRVVDAILEEANRKGPAMPHQLVTGEDGITRCTLCRAASHGEGIFDRVPCKEGFAAVPDQRSTDYGEIIEGHEPAWPLIGEFWHETRGVGPGVYWAWTELGDGVQDWVNLATGDTRAGETGFPNTKWHPLVKNVSHTEAVTVELLRQVADPLEITKAVGQRLQRHMAQEHLAQIAPFVVEHRDDLPHAVIHIQISTKARAIPPMILRHIEAQIGGRKHFHAVNVLSI